MKFDVDPTSDEQVIEYLESLPKEIKSQLAFREYCRATRQVYLWITPEITMNQKRLITQGLKETIYERIELSTIKVEKIPSKPRRQK